MTLTEILPFLFLLALLVAVGLALRSEARNDGYGRRPPPRSRFDEQETRAQIFQRLA